MMYIRFMSIKNKFKCIIYYWQLSIIRCDFLPPQINNSKTNKKISHLCRLMKNVTSNVIVCDVNFCHKIIDGRVKKNNIMLSI